MLEPEEFTGAFIFAKMFYVTKTFFLLAFLSCDRNIPEDVQHERRKEKHDAMQYVSLAFRVFYKIRNVDIIG